jgi:iron complex transport system ATP-binding protein
MTPLLEFTGVGFSYKEQAILEDVNATIWAGQCIALIGPNGAGKTTLLRLAAGTLTATCGAVQFQGKSLSDISRRAAARSIALVPQEMEVPFAFTVEQIVEQGRTPFLPAFGGLRAADREVIDFALELTDTKYLRSRVFNELSGGERQRVKIALGLAQQPRLLLLDEPGQQLDIGRQIELMQLLRHLNSQGITIIASVHDLALIGGTFRCVLSISPGQPVRQGPPEALLLPNSLEQIFRLQSGSLSRSERCQI